MTSVEANTPRLTAMADNAWVRFAVRRLGRLLVSLWVLITAAFVMIHLIPGDPVRAALGPTAPLELVDARREALGLNDPLWLQYLHYLRDVFTGDLGTSMTSGLPVSTGDQRPPARHASSSRWSRSCSPSPSRSRSAWRWRSSPAAAADGRPSWHSPRAAWSLAAIPRVPDRRSGSSMCSASSSTGSRSPAAAGPAPTSCRCWRSGSGPAAVLARIVRVETLGVLRPTTSAPPAPSACRRG